MADTPKLVLASASPRRLALLQQAGIEPDHLHPTDVDETPRGRETPRRLVQRLSRMKAEAALDWARDDDAWTGSYIITADTVVFVVGRVLPKAEDMDTARECLRLLSGRAHRVWSGVCVVTPKGAIRQRLVETRIRFRRLTKADIEAYIDAGEWQGKAGGYAIQGIAGGFVVKLVGSYTNVVGLPLYETIALLDGEGYPIRSNWVRPTTFTT